MAYDLDGRPWHSPLRQDQSNLLACMDATWNECLESTVTRQLFLSFLLFLLHSRLRPPLPADRPPRSPALMMSLHFKSTMPACSFQFENCSLHLLRYIETYRCSMTTTTTIAHFPPFRLQLVLEGCETICKLSCVSSPVIARRIKRWSPARHGRPPPLIMTKRQDRHTVGPSEK